MFIKSNSKLTYMYLKYDAKNYNKLYLCVYGLLYPTSRRLMKNSIDI
jgi:hypothetical protein